MSILRSLGKGNWDITGGSAVLYHYDREDKDDSGGAIPIPYIRVGLGMTNNFDMGAVVNPYPSETAGIWGKYSFVNQPEGLSFAVDGSFGGSFGGYAYTYVDPILSYKLNWFEPYTLLRWNSIIGADESGYIGYLQYTAGVNLWATQKFGININANLIHTFNTANTDAATIMPPIVSVGLIY